VIAAHTPPACFARPTDARISAPLPATSIVADMGFADLLSGTGLLTRETLLRRVGEQWCIVASTNGAFSVAQFQHFGVPRVVAQRLWLRVERFRTGKL
jgi:hypothetical protein